MSEKQETIADIVRKMRNEIAELRKVSPNVPSIAADWWEARADEIEAAHKREAGDAAKLRGVLETLRELLGDLLRLGDAEYHDDFSNFCDIIDAALAEPPRNCDVGTADDWLARFNVVCERCYGSDCDHRLFKNEEVCDCFARWLQMPYESEVSDGNE